MPAYSTRRIVIAGGTGQLGALLARTYHARGHEVVVLTRAPDAHEVPWTLATWDGVTQGPWRERIDGADVVINLAGRSVDCRYTEANRRAILGSRVDSTLAIGESIATAHDPPGLWLQASTATIYGHRYEEPNDETAGWIGQNATAGYDPSWSFSVKVGRAWEEALYTHETPHTRRVALRSAMVMSPDPGGVFDVMRGLVARGLGGTLGDGRQYVSWIHDVDFVRAIDWILGREHLAGPINLAAPGPVPNAEFMRAFRQAWGIGWGLPARPWMLEIGAWFLRTETELLLKSRRVVPGALLEDGFAFEWPEWPAAVEELCQRWRRRQEGQARASRARERARVS